MRRCAPHQDLWDLRKEFRYVDDPSQESQDLACATCSGAAQTSRYASTFGANEPLNIPAGNPWFTRTSEAKVLYVFTGVSVIGHLVGLSCTHFQPILKHVAETVDIERVWVKMFNPGRRLNLAVLQSDCRLSTRRQIELTRGMEVNDVDFVGLDTPI